MSTDNPAGAPGGTPAPISNPGGAPAPAAAASAAADWTASLSDELRGYVQNKGFKAPTDILDSYRNFEKLHGVPQDRLLKIPESLESDEGRQIFERLGKPKDMKDYSITIPKENGDEALATAIREVAFKNNFTQKQVEGLVNWWNGKQTAAGQAAQTAWAARSAQAETTLKQDWGNAYEQNKEIALRGATVLDIGEAELQALGQTLGPDKVMKFLHKMGAATGEHTFVTGGGSGTKQIGADQAKATLAMLEQDQAFINRYRSGDADARKQMDDLHQAAYPGTMGL